MFFDRAGPISSCASSLSEWDAGIVLRVKLPACVAQNAKSVYPNHNRLTHFSVVLLIHADRFCYVLSCVQDFCLCAI